MPIMRVTTASGPGARLGFSFVATRPSNERKHAAGFALKSHELRKPTPRAQASYSLRQGPRAANEIFLFFV